jgi:predicted negative regulator of RcsB-dependent stress response
MAAIKLIPHTKSPSPSPFPSLSFLAARDKDNWANKNRGVVLVFAIVFLVVVGIIALFAYRRWLKRQAEKESYETTD